MYKCSLFALCPNPRLLKKLEDLLFHWYESVKIVYTMFLLVSSPAESGIELYDIKHRIKNAHVGYQWYHFPGSEFCQCGEFQLQCFQITILSGPFNASCLLGYCGINSTLLVTNTKVLTLLSHTILGWSLNQPV